MQKKGVISKLYISITSKKVWKSMRCKLNINIACNVKYFYLIMTKIRNKYCTVHAIKKHTACDIAFEISYRV